MLQYIAMYSIMASFENTSNGSHIFWITASALDGVQAIL